MDITGVRKVEYWQQVADAVIIVLEGKTRQKHRNVRLDISVGGSVCHVGDGSLIPTGVNSNTFKLGP